MKGNIVYGAIHFFLLILYTVKVNIRNFTMYNVFTTTTKDNVMHILHASFLIFLMYSITNYIMSKIFKKFRQDETSSLGEFLLYFLTDFLLVVSIFDDDVNFKNGLLFVMLLCVKVLNWALSIRIKREVEPSLFKLAYGVMMWSCVLCFLFTLSCISGIDGQILFSFEYALLIVASIKNVYVMRSLLLEDDTKRSLYNFYIDIIYLSTTLTIYAIFIWITFLSYRLPLNLFRSALAILDALITKAKLFSRYIKLCKNLEKCIDDPGDGFCAICRDDMPIGKKLSCGHCFHLECLKLWCERQQTCPICKLSFTFKLKKESFVVGNEHISGIPVTIDD